MSFSAYVLTHALSDEPRLVLDTTPTLFRQHIVNPSTFTVNTNPDAMGVEHEAKAAVIRHGYLPEHPIQTELCDVKVKVPKVLDRSGSGVKFNSSLVPPYLNVSC